MHRESISALLRICESQLETVPTTMTGGSRPCRVITCTSNVHLQCPLNSATPLANIYYHLLHTRSWAYMASWWRAPASPACQPWTEFVSGERQMWFPVHPQRFHFTFAPHHTQLSHPTTNMVNLTWLYTQQHMKRQQQHWFLHQFLQLQNRILIILFLYDWEYFCFSDEILSDTQVLSHLILTEVLEDRHYYCPCFTGKEFDKQEDGPLSLSWCTAMLGFEQRPSDSRAWVSTHFLFHL